MESKKEYIQIRNHFTYIIEKMWGGIIVILAFLLNNEESIKLGIELIQKGDIVQGLIALGSAFIIILIFCLFFFLRWYRITFSIKDGTLIYERRTITRRVNTLSIANISNVNLEQNFFEMLFGTYKLRIDTNSLSTADSTDLELILKKKDAYEIKQVIFEMMQETARGEMAETVSDNEQMQNTEASFTEKIQEYDIVYSIKQIVISNLVNVSVGQCIAVVVWAVLVVVAFVNGFFSVKEYGGFLSAAICFIIGACSTCAAILKKAFADYDFCVRREKDRIFVHCGLFKKREYAVPIDKINAVLLDYTFIGRIFKKAYVKVINIGGEGGEATGVKILLSESYEELEKKMKILLPEYDLPKPKEVKRAPIRVMFYKMYLSTVGCLCFLIVGLFVGAIAMGIVQKESIASLLYEIFSLQGLRSIIFPTLAVWIFVLIINVCSYLAKGLALYDEQVTLAEGTFGRRLKNISYDKIQYLTLNQGVFERKLGLCRGEISILASMINQTQVIGRFSKEDFLFLEEKFYKSYHRED